MDDGARLFRIGPCVGRGGFGEVYRSWMRSPGGLETEVALKILRPDPVRRADAVRRFRDEGRMLARLQHPSVVKAWDWADLGDGHLGLVTEFVDGADLLACIGAGLPERALLEALGAVAAALDAAWSTPDADGVPLKVVHRDVKPGNVRIGRHGQVRLLDFGIARFGGEDREAHTDSDVVVGSMPYMAPERFAERSSTPAGDVYGLGCTLYEGLARAPFHRDARLRDLSALALDPGASAVHLRTRLDELGEARAEVRDLVARCLAHDPSARPTAAALLVELERLASTAEGPSLRRWCAEGRMPSEPGFASTWTGRVVTEAAADAEQERPDDGRPRVVHTPGVTLDPNLLDGPPEPVAATTDTPPAQVGAAAPARGARLLLAALVATGCGFVCASAVGLGATALLALARGAL